MRNKILFAAAGLAISAAGGSAAHAQLIDAPNYAPYAPYYAPYDPAPFGVYSQPFIYSQPLYMQADQLLYDTKNNRVIAQGNVEIYYNNYVLTADQVIYDQNVNKLLAEGNAQLKDPNGGITRADRFEALDDFRDAFIQSLSVVTQDDTRIAADRAYRREGNITEYERGKFKGDPAVFSPIDSVLRVVPLVCHSVYTHCNTEE